MTDESAPETVFGPDLPGRPTHPHFGQLVSAVLWADGESTKSGGAGVEAATGMLRIDLKVFVKFVRGQTEQYPMAAQPYWGGLWMDGMVVGAKYAQDAIPEKATYRGGSYRRSLNQAVAWFESVELTDTDRDTALGVNFPSVEYVANQRALRAQQASTALQAAPRNALVRAWTSAFYLGRKTYLIDTGTAE